MPDVNQRKPVNIVYVGFGRKIFCIKRQKVGFDPFVFADLYDLSQQREFIVVKRNDDLVDLLLVEQAGKMRDRPLI